MFKVKRADGTYTRALTLADVVDRYRDKAGALEVDEELRFIVRKVPAPPTDREQMVAQARALIADEPLIHYSMARPIPQYDRNERPMTLDCSGSYISLCRWAGVPSPTGSYTSGSTDTLLARMRPIKKAEALPGDAVLYHYGADGKHVAMFLEPGTEADPLLFSHGLEAGPIAVRLSVENRYHAGETVTFLRLEA
jgi:cell wall-associated NlpC family hydrolase